MDFDFADIKPTLWNVLLCSVMSVLGISFFKFVLAKWNVPYFSDLVASI